MTAVEWLIEELKKPYGDIYMNDILIKAKEMEKQQIKDAFLDGNKLMVNLETYGNKGSYETKVVEFDHLKKTAKIEAERIIDLFYPMFTNSCRDEMTRNCALITIKEMIRECKNSNYDFLLEIENEIKNFIF